MIVLTVLQFLLLGISFPAVCRGVYPAALDQFEHPPATSRIKFRYWIPDASIPVASVQQDIADLASNGAGGLQFVPFYYYGNPSGAPPLTDWNVFGFGTEAFRHLFEGALEAAVENNVLMDFALGASQGQGTPAEPGTEGLSLQLQLGVMTVNPGTVVTGPVPGPQNLTETLLSGGGFMHGLADAEKGELKAVIAGRVISESASDNTATKKVRLDEQSIIDLSQYVENGRLNWQAPAGNGNWKIFSFWEGFTNQVSCTGGVNGTTTIEKGSLVVDHFSEAGARLHTDFFDNHVLVDSTTNEGLRTHSAYAWEDSMELLFALPWTRGFLTRFETTHGYSLVKYLPLLFGQANSWGENFPPYPEEYEYGEYYPDGLSIHNANYRDTLSECYQEYLHSHVQWAKSHGIGFSAQPSYNLPLSFANEIPAVDGPEGESLTFGDRLDAYRSLSGPAQLAGKTDISSEVGAMSIPAFSQTIPDLLLSIKKSYAAGLTMMVIHGMSYSGPYVGTSWPGYQPFAYRFTDTWSRVQPSWQHMKDTLDYLGRNQHILKAGKPRIDLAMYYSPSRWSSNQVYDSDNLQQQGYAYNFISPQNLHLPNVSVSDGLLAPNGPGYQALVFLNDTRIDDKVLSKVKEFSHAGLPVFFVGDVQSPPLSPQPNETGNTSDMVEELIKNDNIHHVSTYDELPAALEMAEIIPRVQIDAVNSSVLSVYRTEPESGIDYIWLFNNAAVATTFTADFRVHGRLPFSLNAWTGTPRPIARYSFSDNRLRIPLTLQSFETTIIALKPLTVARPPWVAYSTDLVEAVNYNRDGRLVASLKGPAVVTINGTENKTLSAVVPSPTELKHWDLEIHDWRAIPNDTSIEPQILVHKFANQSLLPWNDISPELEAMSGIGIYSAKFAVPNIKGIGGFLSVGAIFHTLRAWVNGHQLDPFGADGVKVDITPYIHRGGNNTIRIEVSTTLYNRLKADVDTIWQMGTPLSVLAPTYADSESQAYGLLGPVVIDWVVNKVII
ncbi:hypothetical protein ASPCAL02240 [Aspergillus calidoustus]|uniref:Secreted protein n=1 Tax=Aspergillus calidoustus TaxID=454130 RepID=A0A0U5CMC5_ASPCI|nr:hypothetical protein ASPCAL02240 [Aspergillus calidoustus]